MRVYLRLLSNATFQIAPRKERLAIVDAIQGSACGRAELDRRCGRACSRCAYDPPCSPLPLPHDDGVSRADCFADFAVDARVRDEDDFNAAGDRQAIGRADVHTVSAQRAEARIDVR